MRPVTLSILAALALLPSTALATVPVTAPPPPRIELTEQQREARAQACRSDVQRLFTGAANRPAYLDVAARRAASSFNIRGIGEVLTSTAIELRVYVVAMAEVNLAENWIGSQPAYFQCRFDNDDNVVALEAI